MLKKIWHFLWHDDSALSWVANAAIAFLVIKFIIYPLLGVLLGTSYPIVAVISESMDHDFTAQYQTVIDGSSVYERPTGKYVLCGTTLEEKRRTSFDTYWDECGEWYEQRNITKEEFADYPMHNGFKKGDIIILSSAENAQRGDIIVFLTSRRPEPIIHRVVEVNEDTYVTKGDHNSIDDGQGAKENVIGKALLRIPLLGWVKIIFSEIMSGILGVFT